MADKVATEDRLFCPKSPNNRHHWTVAYAIKDGSYPAVCQYCLQMHNFGTHPKSYFC